MPKLLTAYFGELDYTDTSVFEFPDGLPGFEEERAFVFLRQPHTEPLIFMQSLISPALCFLMLPVMVACPDYQLSVAPEDLCKLHLPIESEPRIGEDILCGVLICTPRDGEPTVNLLAPVVVSLEARVGMQVIQCGTPYSHKHPLLVQEELAKCS